MIDIADTEEWRRLGALRAGAPRLRDAFARDPDRARRLSREAAGVFIDFSKNRIDDAILRELIALARKAGLEAERARLFAGERVNDTENRAALHVALRDFSTREYRACGEPVSAAIRAEREKMKAFCAKIDAGDWRGFRGDRIEAVVNIGIGGSDLGPQMAVEALRPYWIAGRRTHFVSNVDGAHLSAALAAVDPAKTLFIIASKTFSTEETMTNAASARYWFLAQGAGPADVARHFVALSTDAAAVARFGIAPEARFGFWDWVGGRFSLWSAIGLSVALQVGFANFDALLAGANAMDRHFETVPLEDNLPALLALVGVWNRNFEGAPAHAILPYDQGLARLPSFLQQLEMESNGKSRRRDGATASLATAPVVFGEPGTNGQHAFHQLLHQGTDVISADFIAPALSCAPLGDHHEKLLAHFLAQAAAMMRGRTEEEALAELAASGLPLAEAARLAPHKVFPGDRPTTAILVDRLTPATLGALIALYEHKVFVQGVIWGVNSFDQWGVELGKTLAAAIRSDIAAAGEKKAPARAHDASTNALIDRINAARGG